MHASVHAERRSHSVDQRFINQRPRGPPWEAGASLNLRTYFLMGVVALVVSSLAFSLNQEDNECDVIKRHDGALGESDHSACVDLCVVSRYARKNVRACEKHMLYGKKLASG